jgi:hypothetical protein
VGDQERLGGWPCAVMIQAIVNVAAQAIGAPPLIGPDLSSFEPL